MEDDKTSLSFSPVSPLHLSPHLFARRSTHVPQWCRIVSLLLFSFSCYAYPRDCATFSWELCLLSSWKAWSIGTLLVFIWEKWYGESVWLWADAMCIGRLRFLLLNRLRVNQGKKKRKINQEKHRILHSGEEVTEQKSQGKSISYTVYTLWIKSCAVRQEMCYSS